MSTSIQSYLASRFPFFEDDVKDILTEKGTLKTIPAGKQIMRPGQYFQHMILIARGRVKLYREGDDGNEFFIYYLDPGTACALSMICATKNEQNPMLATAIEDTDLIMVPITLMDDLMRNHRSWYTFVLENYRRRFQELLLVVDSIAFKGMDERLEFYLKRQKEQLNSRELQLTHQQIADDLNSSREVISRLLKKMEKEKKLILHRSSIEILD